MSFKSSLDSGCGSAMKSFFNSIDDYIANAETSSISSPSKTPSPTISDRGELQKSQLEFLKSAIDNDQNSYGIKLMEIMIKGLKETLGHIFEVTIEFGLPKSFLPVISLNTDNTPYVEFIVKSDKADDAPFSAKYTPEHLKDAQYIMEKLIKVARNKRISSTPCKNPLIDRLYKQQVTTYPQEQRNTIGNLYQSVRHVQSKQFQHLQKLQQQQSTNITRNSTPSSYHHGSSRRVAQSNSLEPDPLLEATDNNQLMNVSRSSSRRVNPNRSCKSLNISYSE